MKEFKPVQLKQVPKKVETFRGKTREQVTKLYENERFFMIKTRKGVLIDKAG